MLDLLKSDHAWLNERLAKHYGIPYVYGPRFRRIALEFCEDEAAEGVRYAEVSLSLADHAGRFAVGFRPAGAPVQLLHHGVANLPGECRVSVVAEPASVEPGRRPGSARDT